MLLIYSPRRTQRLDYILQVLLGERLGLDFEICTSKDDFLSSDLPRIVYASIPIDGVPFIASAELLFETGTSRILKGFAQTTFGPALFCTGHPESSWPFDPFAASFYLLTRYEEYQPYKPDEHGRFDLSQSMLRFENRHLVPWVDRWLLRLAEWLYEAYPALPIRMPAYTFQPSYDIDVAYAYRLKGLFRNAGLFGRDILRRDFSLLRERSSVVFGSGKDPFDTYDLIFDLHRNHEPTPIFFFLFAQFSDYDKNPAVHNPRFRSLIKRVRDNATVGIHPSYFSIEHPEYLRQELQGLSAVVNEPVRMSRQHYLRMSVPSTYRMLSTMGIDDDYSMGFASSPGFRAGTSSAYPFYDLEFEMQMSLRVHPFAIMDGSLLDYMRLGPAQALELCLNILKEVRNASGTFCTLWHNESLSETGRWRGWRSVYSELVNSALVTS